MTDRTAPRIAWLLWSVSLALAGAGAALVLISLDSAVPDNWGFRGYWDLAAPFVATPGLLVARRQPRNAIGWILLVAGLASGFGGFVQEYATRAVIIAPGSLPGAVALAWIASWTWAFFAGPMLTLVPQLFPTGRPLSPRWAPLLLNSKRNVAPHRRCVTIAPTGCALPGSRSSSSWSRLPIGRPHDGQSASPCSHVRRGTMVASITQRSRAMSCSGCSTTIGGSASAGTSRIELRTARL
jgi:hypothetical protein